MSESNFPLTWPTGWKRTPAARRGRARFSRSRGQLSIADGLDRVLRELGAMGVDRNRVVISTNVPVRLDGLPYSMRREPDDSGVAVYWWNARTGKQQALAIDHYDRVADNLAAIAATLGAFRAIERHGGGQILDRAQIGLQAALPAPDLRRSWQEVLGFDGTGIVTRWQVDTRYRQKAMEVHKEFVDKPEERDARLRELNEAIGEARAATL